MRGVRRGSEEGGGVRREGGVRKLGERGSEEEGGVGE